MYHWRALQVDSHWFKTSWIKNTLRLIVGLSSIISPKVFVGWPGLFTRFKTPWTQVKIELKLPVRCCSKRRAREGVIFSCTWPSSLASNLSTPAFGARLITWAMKPMRWFVALDWGTQPSRALTIGWLFEALLADTQQSSLVISNPPKVLWTWEYNLIPQCGLWMVLRLKITLGVWKLSKIPVGFTLRIKVGEGEDQLSQVRLMKSTNLKWKIIADFIMWALSRIHSVRKLVWGLAIPKHVRNSGASTSETWSSRLTTSHMQVSLWFFRCCEKKSS